MNENNRKLGTKKFFFLGGGGKDLCSENGESTNIVHIIQNERVQITGLLFIMEE